MSQTGEPNPMKANLGPDRKTTATGTMRTVGPGCTEHNFDEHKKRANAAMEDALSDQQLSTKEMGNKRIKHPQDTRDKAAIAKAAAGAAGEDNDRDAEEALDHGAFGALVTERPTVAGGKGYISLVDLSDIKGRLAVGLVDLLATFLLWTEEEAERGRAERPAETPAAE